MIDGSGKRNRQLPFELQNSHVCEKRTNLNGISRGRLTSPFNVLDQARFGHHYPALKSS